MSNEESLESAVRRPASRLRDGARRSGAASASADEVWVSPTYQQELGGLGVGSNGIWPVTPIGAVRLAWGVPNNLQTFQSAKVALIPHAPGAGTLTLYVCRAQHADLVGAACTGPTARPFTGAANRLLEVDVSSAIGPQVGTAGLNYLAVLAYTAPTTTTDRIVGLRFGYQPVPFDDRRVGGRGGHGSQGRARHPRRVEARVRSRNSIGAERGDCRLAGLHSVGGLGGLTCQLNGQDGTTVVATATDGRITITCQVAPPPQPTFCCTLDLPTASALAGYLHRPPTAMPILQSCVGSMSGFGTGACVRTSSTRVSASTTPGGVMIFLLNEDEFETDYAMTQEFGISTLPALTVDYTLVGLPGSCQLTAAGHYRLITDQTSEMITPAAGPLHRLRLTTVHAPSGYQHSAGAKRSRAR